MKHYQTRANFAKLEFDRYSHLLSAKLKGGATISGILIQKYLNKQVQAMKIWKHYSREWYKQVTK
jgi:hypothetical protein